MSKVAIMLAPGFEEAEALNVVDVLRRAEIQCDMIATEELMVKGAHDILVQADALLSEAVKDYDMIVLPGGMPGSTNLRDNGQLMTIIKDMNTNHKFICAICAAPIALNRAGVLEGKQYTCYPSFEEEISSNAIFKEDLVVVDGNVITSRGPATVFHFAYALVEALGKDTSAMREGMLFNLALGTNK